LPVTLRVAQENLGIKPAVASSILPLGATVNMDGTALFVTLMALFSAQVFDIPLDAMDYAMIVLTTTLVSIGTASVPSASLFLLATVLGAIGASPEQVALIVGFILPFDRILDMARTVPNITGDLAVSLTVAKWEDELDLDTYNAKPTV
jgi:Na+/H+-dicarboxylate symporter